MEGDRSISEVPLSAEAALVFDSTERGVAGVDVIDLAAADVDTGDVVAVGAINAMAIGDSAIPVGVLVDDVVAVDATGDEAVVDEFAEGAVLRRTGAWLSDVVLLFI